MKRALRHSPLDGFYATSQRKEPRWIPHRVSKLIQAILPALLLLALLLLNGIASPAYAHDFGNNTTNPGNDQEKPDPRANDPDGCTDKPIGLLSGVEIYTQVDLQMNGLFPIRLVRMYSSQSDYDSPLGYGWAFAHDRRLFEYADGSVSIRYGCGWHDEFKYTGGAFQTPKDGLEGQLTQQPDGTYERLYRNGGIDIYDQEGRLVIARNPFGHQLEYLYSTNKYPLTGTSHFSVDPNTPMIVAHQYRLLTIQERAADGVLTGNSVTFHYNDQTGRLDSIVTSDGRTVTYTHDQTSDGLTKGNLVTVTGLEGIVSTYRYEDNRDSHNATSFQEGTGTTPFVNTYNELDQVSSQTYGNKTVTFQYPINYLKTLVTRTIKDDQGNVLHSGDTVYEFSPAGYVSVIIDPLGNKKTIQRDGFNHLDKVEYQTNVGTVQAPSLQTTRIVDYDFDSEGNKRGEVIHLLSSNGNIFKHWDYEQGWLSAYEVSSDIPPYQTLRTEFTFYRDANNRPTNIKEIERRRMDGTFQTITLYPDAKNRITTIQFDDGHNIQVAYENGSLYPTVVYREDGATMIPYLAFHLDYDQYGNVSDVWDGRNQHTGALYDSLGRMIQLTNALNQQTLFTYNDWRLEQIENGRTDADGEGRIVKLLYDAKDRVDTVQRKDDQGVLQTLWRYTYDSEDNVLSATDGEGRRWQYGYDILSRLTSSTDSFLNQWKYERNILGDITKVTNPNNIDTLYDYDGDRRLIRVEEPGETPALITRFGHNALGEITSVTDPKQQTTTYQYDNLGRLINVIQSLGQALQYFYDSRNRLDYLINARGQKIDLSYESWGPVQRIDYYANITTSTIDRTVGYQYDYAGNLTRVTDTAVQSGPLYGYTYDALNRVDLETVYGIGNADRQLDHDYDRYGNRDRLAVSVWNGSAWQTDFIQQYRFNPQDQMQWARLISNANINFDYYKNDELKQIAFPSGVSDDFAYYDNGPLKWVKIANGAGQIEALSYTYDKLLNVQDIIDNDGRHTYKYDNLSRLTGATHPAASGLPATEKYRYDTAGNREDPTDPGFYAYDANNRNIHTGFLNSQTGQPGITHTFDDSGNLTQSTDGSVYTYDHDNRLTRYQKGPIDASYTYDAFGRRIKKDVNGSITWYLWDGSDIIVEYGESGQSLTRYAYTPYDYAPMQIQDSHGVYDVHLDALGAPRLLTDQNQQVVWRTSYEAFGKAVIDDDVDGNGTTVTFNVRNPGQWNDAESGLYYNRFRYYNPSSGRYITADPIGQAGGLNLYSYVYNSPQNWVDPLGLDAGCGCGVICPEVYIECLKDPFCGILLITISANTHPDKFFDSIFGENNESDTSESNESSDNNFTTPATPPDPEGGDDDSEKKKTHGNKLDDKPAEGYSLRNRRSGEIQKYGETTRGEDKFGAGKQKRYTKKYMKEKDLSYVKETSGTKKDMHQWQHEKIKEHKASNNGKRPPLNKSDY